MKGVFGYSLFSIAKVLHGAHIRPYELCKELGIPLAYRASPHAFPLDLLIAIAKKTDLLIFPGYTADYLSLLLIFLAKFRRCKLILDVADIPYLQYQFFQGEPSQKSIRDFSKLVHLADVLLFSTRSLQIQAAKTLDIGNKQNYLIENASDPDHFKFNPLPDENVILFVGGYIPARGVDELIQAFKIVRGRGRVCTLRLVGLRYPESLEDEGISIFREVYYDQIPSLFSGAYVFVIPHRSNIYMNIAAPLKLFDAMASGLPVVTTPREETVAIIDNERCGLVSGDDSNSIADAIEYLIEHRDVAVSMGLRGRSAVESKYSWKVRAEELSKIINVQQTSRVRC